MRIFEYRNGMREMILNGDCRTVMQSMMPETYQTCITSPPYLWVRDYNVPSTDFPEVTYIPMTGTLPLTVPAWTGCLGLEPTVEMFIAHIVLIMREVWRVLRKDGTLWLNFGDTYFGSGKGCNADGLKNLKGKDKDHNGRYTSNLPYKEFKSSGLKPKDLIMVPARIALALQADGWYVRSDIIWSKSNAMPESAVDRPTKAHEYMHLFSKSRYYYYDDEAIREPVTGSNNVPIAGSKGAFGPKQSRRRRGNARVFRGGGAYVENQAFDNSISVEREARGNAINESGMRNKRSVWTVATAQTKEAHFATFPEKLIEPPVLAGSSPQACPHCGAPWKRKKVKVADRPSRFIHLEVINGALNSIKNEGSVKSYDKSYRIEQKPIGRIPTCKCKNNDGSGKCHIIDPFGGLGTTMKVALENNRECTSIDINPEYTKINKRRTAVIQPVMNI
jgi:DNA modification methylase